MLLAHNKSILTYLFKAIEHRKIADGSVGYYIGGMKEPALKLTETKKIILATFSMAAEALDIKTLTTLFLMSPKTDVQQAVGRILRVKHSNPLVVDFVDSHDIFQSQWRKRLTFYRKQNYKIVYTNNEMYKPYKIDSPLDNNSWKVVNVPSAKQKEKKGENDKPKAKPKCLIKIVE